MPYILILSTRYSIVFRYEPKISFLAEKGGSLMYVIKRIIPTEAWNVQKVVVAVNKSAYRAMVKFTPRRSWISSALRGGKGALSGAGGHSHRRNAQYR